MDEPDKYKLPSDVKTPSSAELKLKESAQKDSQIESSTEIPSQLKNSEELIGQTIDEKYEVLSFVGRGGLGLVYQARHKIANKIVALKVLLPGKHLEESNLARFKREARTAMDMNHPNIAGVQDIGFYNSMPYIVMEYVDGKPLYDLLKEGTLSTPDKVSILKQVCQAMEYARKNNVIHRDLKPDNIIVSKKNDGSLKSKIVDFGIAKDLDEKDEVTLTKTGEMFGTPLYMSPEQINGNSTDHRSDIYSIGCIAYEFFNGQAPFKYDSALAILNAHLEEEAPKLKPPQSLKGIELVIAKSLSKDKLHRYQTAQEMLEEIERIEQGQKPKATNLPVSKKTTKRILIACIISCLAILIGLLAFLQTFKLDTINSFSERIRSNPQDVISLIGRGRLYAEAGQYQNAISDFDKAIKYADDKTNKSMAFVRKSSAQIALNKYKEALVTVNKGIDIKPEFYRGYLVRARIAQFNGQNSEAIKDFKKSIVLNNVVGPQQINIAISYANLANIYANNENWKESITNADKALERFPGYEFAYISKARSHIALGQLENCIKDCEEIFKVNAKSKAAFEFRGTAYSGLGKYDKAIADFDEWISVDPTNPTAYLKRGIAYRKTGNLVNAKTDIDKAFELGADNYSAFFELATILKSNKDYSRALELVNKALEKKLTKKATNLKKEILELLN